MLPNENTSIDQGDAIFHVKKYYAKNVNRDHRYLVEEERLFNNAFIKLIHGQRHRCTKISFTKEHLRKDIEVLLDDSTVPINSFLKRVVGPSFISPNYRSERSVVAALTQQFRRELKSTLSKDTPGYRLLKENEAQRVSCYFIASGPDSSTFEGSFNLELRWYAESIRDGRERLRPIVFSYCSRVNV